MFRYVGLVWDALDAEQSYVASQLRQRLSIARSWASPVVCFDIPGVFVVCTDPQSSLLGTFPLADARGVVLGSLFFRDASDTAAVSHQRVVLTASESAAIVASTGQRLIDRYWGNYVAFLHDHPQHKTLIVKDPSGSLPCLTTEHRGVRIALSCVADVTNLELPPPTLNFAYLSHRIVSGRRNQLISPFNEISAVGRGECLEITARQRNGGMRRKLLWTPLSFAGADDRIEDPARASTLLRASVRRAVHTWASCSGDAVLRLSGGLDSSVILGCLKDAPSANKITCYTLYGTEGRGDPRPWARLALQGMHCRHVEVQVPQLQIDFAQLPRMLPSYEPGGVLTEHIDTGALEQALPRTTASAALFSGDGGDSVFGSSSASFGVTDYLRLHGLQPRILSLAAQVAAVTGESTFSVLAQSLRRWVVGTRMNDRPITPDSLQLVEPQVLEQTLSAERYPHPWFATERNVPWSRIRQLGMLLSAPAFYPVTSAFAARSLVAIAPLYSQPVVETLLRMPSYVLFHGGRDRGLARQAFVGDVPQPILDRLWKDRAPGTGEILIARNLRFLRELLLDGVLVRERLLNRAALDRSLLAQPGANRTCAPQMLDYMEIEMWAREWSDIQAQRRAA